MTTFETVISRIQSATRPPTQTETPINSNQCGPTTLTRLCQVRGSEHHNQCDRSTRLWRLFFFCLWWGMRHSKEKRLSYFFFGKHKTKMMKKEQPLLLCLVGGHLSRIIEPLSELSVNRVSTRYQLLRIFSLFRLYIPF